MLDVLQFLQTLVPQREVLFPHLRHQHLHVFRLRLQHLRVLVVLLLQLVLELLDQPVLRRDDQLEGFLLLLDRLHPSIPTFDSDSHSSCSFSSDHLISRAVFFLFEITASCWMAASLSWARCSSCSREFFCSCSFLTLMSWMGVLVSISLSPNSAYDFFTCFFPSSMSIRSYNIIIFK